MKTRVSVITAVKDNVIGLQRCLESVFQQGYAEIESIVIDGGSSDGTIEVLKALDDRLHEWVSEPDDGIADAMNKGLSRATGELILFLHSDDYLPDGEAIERCVAYVDDLSAIWAFDVLFENMDHLQRVHPGPLSWWARFRNPIPHQGVLCPRALFESLGGFDRGLRIVMDYDFWCRAMKAGVRLVRVPAVLAVMGGGGISSRRDWNGLCARFDEERRVQERHAESRAWLAAYTLFWPLYRAYRWLRLQARGSLSPRRRI